MGRGRTPVTRPMSGMRWCGWAVRGRRGCRSSVWVRSRWPAAPGSTATLNATRGHPGSGPPVAGDLGGLRGRRGGARRGSPGREAVSAPAGRPGRCGRPGGGADHRRRGRWPGARGRGGQDHRGRPRSARGAGRGRAAAALRVLLAHRRVRAAHGHRPGRGRRRGLGRGRSWPGSPRSSRSATPRPPRTSCASIAFGWLARPAELLQLLLEHRDPQEALDLELKTADEVTPSRATAFPADLLDALREVDLSPLAPRAVLYVHLHQAAVHGAGRAGGVARVEGLGPVTLTGLHALLARTRLDGEAGARPVRPGPQHRLRAPRVPQGTGPPDHRRRLLALRHLDQPPRRLRPPDPLHETPAHRARPAPTTPAHSADDTTAGRPTPATAPDNAAQGRYVWLTPHGLGLLVDHRGTRPISDKHARMILDAPPGVDIYPT